MNFPLGWTSHFCRAIIMLTNSKAEMGAHLSRIDSSLTTVHIGAGTPVELPAETLSLVMPDE